MDCGAASCFVRKAPEFTCKMRRAAWCGACQDSWRDRDSPTRFCLCIRLARRSCGRRRCRRRERSPNRTQFPSSGPAEAVDVTLVVERSGLLDELQDAEHAFATFAVHFAEFYRETGAGIEAGDDAFCGKRRIVH